MKNDCNCQWTSHLDRASALALNAISPVKELKCWQGRHADDGLWNTRGQQNLN